MNYTNLLTKINKYKKIAVTGPQRSGTCIASRILSSDLGYKWIGEGQYSFHDINKFADLIKNNDNCVVHCAFLSLRILEMPKDIVIIFLHRNIGDIIDSVNRLRFSSETKKDYINTISKKYDFYQKIVDSGDLNNRLFALEYESLSFHDLWVDRDKRVDWGPWQWQIKKAKQVKLCSLRKKISDASSKYDSMRYSDLLKYIRKYSKIAVTGPARSGNHIAATALSIDLGIKMFDEGAFDYHNIEKFANIVDSNDNCIMICPELSYNLLEMPEDMGIIFIDRNIDDIIASGIRIGKEEDRDWWIQEPAKRYDYYNKILDSGLLGDRLYALKYESLSEHKLWINKELRINWTWGQTRSRKK